MAAESEEKLPRPPRRCTPEQFYVDYLPALWRALSGDLVWPSYAYELTFSIDEPESDPESFTVRFDAGTLTGRAGGSDSAVTEIRFDQASWTLAANDLFPRGIRRSNKRLAEVREEMERAATRLAPKLDPEKVRSMPGNVEIDFTDDAGDKGLFRVVIAGGGGPTARIEARDEDLWALLECGGQFVSLLKSRAQLDGDVGYLFQLARFFEGA